MESSVGTAHQEKHIKDYSDHRQKSQRITDDNFLDASVNRDF